MGGLASRPLRTVVVGAGPAGLFYALLAKERMPSHEIVLYERNAPDATFGFGVVFSERTLGGFAHADSGLYEAMAAAGVAWDDIEVRRADGRLRCGGHGFSAIARRSLLALMQARAREVGVGLHFEHTVTAQDLVGADLILAADGVNSVIRAEHEAVFRPQFASGDAKFIWFATRQPFDALTFIFVKDEHGIWGVHAYPFEQGTSTFIVETDEATWRRAGLDQPRALPPGASDMKSLHLCERLFADHLGGHGLMENNSRWAQFRTLRCASWGSDNVALLGDAAHTAHFSVGSGTRMAMEDAAALADAVSAADTVPGALAEYELARRPAVDYIQAAARPSMVWWERFRHVADRDLEQFMFHFLSRSPMVTRERLLRRDWRFVRRVDRWAAALGDGTQAGPLATGFDVGPLHLPSRIIAAPAADEIAGLAGLAIAGAGLVLAAGSGPWADAVAWVHGHTGAAVGLRIQTDAPVELVQRAADDAIDVLVAPIATSAARVWPTGRVLLSVVDAPADSEGYAADQLLSELSDMAANRPLIVGVTSDERQDPTAALMFCDRAIQDLNLPCAAIDILDDQDAAVTEILAGRVDLVQGLPSLSSSRWARSGSRPNARGEAPMVSSPALRSTSSLRAQARSPTRW